jgi:hypothetical protein
MKITKKDAVAFLVALGFSKAATWKPGKIKERLTQAPDKVAEDDVPEGFMDLYTKLGESGGTIELTDTKPEKEAAETKETPMPKKEKETKKEAKKETKKAPATAARDGYGCRMGSISQKVNSVVEGEWMTEQEIADAAKVTLDQARGRLYYAAQEGLMEHRRLVQYRLVKKPAKK